MLYPIKFYPILKERIWGGSLIINKIHPNLNDRRDNIGESWEISDRQQDQSIVSNGVYTGYTFKQLREKYKTDFLGTLLNEEEPFPLLVKVLDAKEDLSLQVHPKAEDLKYLTKEAQPKTEFWYILHHTKNAQIMVGLKKDLTITKDEFFKSTNSLKVKDYINSYPSQENMLFYIESGTIHAIGGGNLILEIQQNSDTTYRISDWGRKDKNGELRELHLTESKICMDFNNKSNIPIEIIDLKKNYRVVESPIFKTDSYYLSGKVIKKTAPTSCEVISCTEGILEIQDKGLENKIILSKGQSALIPANLEVIFNTTTSANYLATYFVKSL